MELQTTEVIPDTHEFVIVVDGKTYLRGNCTIADLRREFGKKIAATATIKSRARHSSRSA